MRRPNDSQATVKTAKHAVFGASGHAKVVVDTLRCAGMHVGYIFDDAPDARSRTVEGIPVAGGRDEFVRLQDDIAGAIVGIGNNAARMQVMSWLRDRAVRLVSAIHPRSVVASSAVIGEGTLVVAGCVINADARIGDGVIVNTGTTVDHDCVVEDGAHLAPGVHLCGNVLVGREALLGVGTVVIPGVRIGPGAVIGAGSVVIQDVPAGARMAGSPCRPIDKA